MLPYQPNSDALVPPAPLLALEPVFPLLRDGDPVLARVVFSILSLAFVGLAFSLGEGLGEAFATNAFFGVGFGIGFGVVFCFDMGVAVGFGVSVAIGVGFGLGEGNSISLLAPVTIGSSCAS